MQISCSFPLHNITFELPRAETFPFAVLCLWALLEYMKSINNPIFCRKMTGSARWRSQLISEIPQGPTLRKSLRSSRGKILTGYFPNAQPFLCFLDLLSDRVKEKFYPQVQAQLRVLHLLPELDRKTEVLQPTGVNSQINIHKSSKCNLILKDKDTGGRKSSFL